MNIVILGGGSFGTALGNQISYNTNNKVVLLLKDKEVEKEVNKHNTNSKYYPNRNLSKLLSASTNYSVLKDADVLFIAVSTAVIPELIERIKPVLNPSTLIVNMAKGIFEEGQTIVSFLQEKLDHDNVITLKGASFSAEMIKSSPTLFTIGFKRKTQLNIIEEVIEGSYIYLDHTIDVFGVELLSALKNIYAILLGNIDAKFNAANTRFLFLTRAFSEMRTILKAMGGKEETLFLSCGIGDMSLSSLNDLSRNRTLGLLIGKGFYNESLQENTIVLEGVKTLKLINAVISEDLKKKLPLFKELTRFLIDKEGDSLKLNFNDIFKKNYKTVLTYGTFDLLHYGHMEILRKSRELGDRLIVGLSTDDFNLKKGKVCEINYKKRKQLLESLPFVDLVIPEKNWDQKVEDVLNHQADIFVMGDDWKDKFDFLKEHCEVLYLPRTKGISTTALKKAIKF